MQREMEVTGAEGAPNERRPLRLLHASDCHLGAHAEPGAHEEAFVDLVDAARRWAVDALILAGDVFDHARVSDDALRWTASQLGRLGCPTVILPGNHDALGPSSPYLRLDFQAVCPLVRVITEPDGEVVHLTNLDLALWGRPVVDHHPSFRPLADPPPRPGAAWSVAVGHGLLLEKDGPTDRGSPIFPSDLEAISWDYVALGHWPVFWPIRSGPSPACYAGPTSGHFNWPPGAVLVDLVDGREALVRRLALDAVDVEPLGETAARL